MLSNMKGNSMSNLSVNAIRFLGIDAINKANSGHPGVVMGAAPMAYSLFTKQLRINPAQPNWINRDRFILSAGHGSMLFMPFFTFLVLKMLAWMRLRASVSGVQKHQVTRIWSYSRD